MGKLANPRKLFKVSFIVLILVSVAIFLAHSDLSALKKELNTIGYRFVFILLTTLVAYFFGTLGWWICLGASKNRIRLRELYAIRLIGETVGLFNPTSIIGGDLLKADLVSRYGIPKKESINAVAISRITAVLSQLTLFLLAMCWLMLSPLRLEIMRFTGQAIYILCACLLLFMAFIFYWLVSTKSPPCPSSASSSFFGKARIRIQVLCWSIKEFYQQQNKIFWCSYLLFAIHWLIGSLEFYLILRFLTIDVQVIHGLILDMSVIILKSAGAFIPGQLGIEEISNKLLLNMIGITGGSIWLSVSILRRGRQVFWIAIGFIFYLCIKRKNIHVTV
ncbi:flippase-like domain-containing protein [Sphingobacterium sp. N143]|uniref:lysylphosphatidylglycerol synthase transmembrane domain-containing protein n=1 Tax=Sphingobacterium sp. N143 TaxID=2746727 RepID=UPI0025776836|nr:lysylphosphatidylglycerol synthase transmembrane domain-containing protein [Sphingobacterium sp. N143]MDM1292990.1 flippase-like domain-containing protein [Sphingobacterium sp. N143]